MTCDFVGVGEGGKDGRKEEQEAGEYFWLLKQNKKRGGSGEGLRF